MTTRLRRRIRALCWVLASLLLAVLLARLDIGYRSALQESKVNVDYPVKLGAVSMLTEPGSEPVLSPEAAVRRSDWTPVQLPLSVVWRREAVWTRMVLHNTSDTPQSVWLEVSPPRLTHVHLHSLEADGHWTSQTSGAVMRSADRPLNMAELVFPLTLAPGEHRLVLASIDSQITALNLSFDVFPATVYPGIAARFSLLDTFFFGGLLVLGIMSLALGGTLRQFTLVLLALRIMSVSLWQMQQQGILAMILPAATVSWLTLNAQHMASAVLIFIAAFSWSFLAHARLPRWVHWTFAGLLLASLALSPLLLAGLVTTLAFPSLVAYLSVAVLIFTSAVSIRLIFSGFLLAVPMLAGAAVALVVNTPLYSIILGWAGGNVVRYFVSPLPSFVTSIILFLGAALHLVRVRQKLDLALRNEQRNAVARLEQQVAERTVQLVVARDQAETANRAKSFFLAKVSHELRTPMHTMLGYLDLLQREPAIPTVKKKLATVDMAGRQLVNQIDALLDYARLEREELKLQPESTATHALAQHVGERAMLLAAERGIAFMLDLAPELPRWVRVDAGRLEQVLMILLNNAVRYTQAGRVELRIGAVPMPSSDAQGATVALRFEVSDTGRGISPEALARIFQPFERGDSVDGKGLGLGLPIASQLLAAMGSQLEVQSRVGEGSSFRFVLQLPLSQELEAAPQDHVFTGYQGRTRRVLLLDDNASNRRYLEELLGDLGFEVFAFADVPSASACLRDAAPGERPHLCIVDQHLGDGESSWSFIQTLRSAGSPLDLRGCPVLMLSAAQAYPPPGLNLPHGIDQHLLKPVDLDALLQAIGDLLGLVWIAQPPSAHPGAGPAQLPAASQADAWLGLAAAGEEGDLSALDAWMGAHAGLCADDPELQRFARVLDFAAIVDHARRRAAMA